ncbi:MAG: hypothetical protein JNM00_04730, partial [Flavobacteriales bacterium]|nr:hypothetical protein [Flavobacteriales bacterium]
MKNVIINFAHALAVICLSGLVNSVDAKYASAETFGFTLDLSTVEIPNPQNTYTWYIGNFPPMVTPNPPPVVFDQAGTYNVAIHVLDAQGQLTIFNDVVEISAPAFPYSIVDQNGLMLTVDMDFPFAPGFTYKLSYDGGLTSLTIPPSGILSFPVPEYGTWDLCVSAFNGLGNQVGINTCVMVDVFEFCITPLILDFTLSAPDSIECGSPAGFCVGLNGAGTLSDYCADFDLGYGTVLEDVNVGEVCPFGFFYDCAGTYEVEITIHCCDYPLGFAKKINHTITVTCDCSAPLSSYFDMFTVVDNTGDDCGDVGACFYLQNGGTYDALGGYCVSWDWGDGTDPTETILFSCPSHHYECNGNYTITATIHCCYDNCESIQFQESVTINCPCNIDDLGVTAWGINVTDCTVNGTFFGGECMSGKCLDWNWGDGSPIQTGNDLTHTFPASGSYTIEVTVYCCDDATSFKKFYHEVSVVCPCTIGALQNFPSGGLNVFVPADPLCMSAIGTYAYPPDIDPSQYCIRWLWGDGSNPEVIPLNETAVHSYSENGT